MNAMLFPEDVTNVIQSFYLFNKGDETTTDENEAFQAYRSGNRNYLLRATYSIDRPRMIERWDEEQECWRT